MKSKRDRERGRERGNYEEWTERGGRERKTTSLIRFHFSFEKLTAKESKKLEEAKG